MRIARKYRAVKFEFLQEAQVFIFFSAAENQGNGALAK
ncbi:hypothetical protein BAZOLSSOX_1334 [uncultured Gammaproteobacteria bacterium]|nr:hypothetical protein BAZOLSSOX_1334 [uncultured Gammaproteobacteria bacterium]